MGWRACGCGGACVGDQWKRVKLRLAAVMRRAVRCSSSIWFGRPSVEMKMGWGGEICAIWDELKWVSGVTWSIPSMCNAWAPCVKEKREEDKHYDSFQRHLPHHRRLTCCAKCWKCGWWCGVAVICVCGCMKWWPLRLQAWAKGCE